jgi:transposase-like protein
LAAVSVAITLAACRQTKETAVKQSTLHELLWQVGSEDIGRVFREQMTLLTRELILEVMAREVTALCGQAYHPSRGACRRAGSAPGWVVVDGRAEAVVRPRVRRRNDDGAEGEFGLASYRAARDLSAVRDGLLRAATAGVSTRQAKRMFPCVPGSSSSSVSRLWAVAGKERLAAFRGRDLSGERWFGLILDGIHLAADLAAIVAVGLTVDGRKVVLDFEVGASENREVCNRLLGRVVHRGLRFGGPPLAVVDGSKALADSLLSHFPDVRIQRCLVHKERNIRGCLSHRHYGELSRLFNRLRAAEGEGPALEAVAELHRFLAGHSYKAVESLDEAGDSLTTLHRLQAPSTLNASLLSTNCIENVMHNCRSSTGRVARWRPQTDQADRWLAYALGEAEGGFRRIRGWRDIPELLAGLQWPAARIEEARQAVAAALAAQVTPPRNGPGGPARACATPPRMPVPSRPGHPRTHEDNPPPPRT